MFRSLIKWTFFLSVLFISWNAAAESCTYREAVLALKSGNSVRGLALLKMAANDGDKRAILALQDRRTHGEQKNIALNTLNSQTSTRQASQVP